MLNCIYLHLIVLGMKIRAKVRYYSISTSIAKMKSTDKNQVLARVQQQPELYYSAGVSIHLHITFKFLKVILLLSLCLFFSCGTLVLHMLDLFYTTFSPYWKKYYPWFFSSLYSSACVNSSDLDSRFLILFSSFLPEVKYNYWVLNLRGFFLVIFLLIFL